MEFLAPLIGAASSLLGGLFGSKSAADAQKANAQAQAAINAQNIAEQEKFAQNSIQWKVADAAKVGISPLAAIGAQGMSFSNNVFQPTAQPDSSLAKGIADAGQSFAGSMQSLASKESQALDLDLKRLQVKSAEADVIAKQAEASRIAVMHRQPGSPVGVPLPPDDPRGPVIPLMQRARDPRTGEIVWIPSEKAASPLQTLAASPTNAALAGRGFSEGLLGFPGNQDHWLPQISPDVSRKLRDYYYRGFGY